MNFIKQLHIHLPILEMLCDLAHGLPDIADDLFHALLIQIHLFRIARILRDPLSVFLIGVLDTHTVHEPGREICPFFIGSKSSRREHHAVTVEIIRGVVQETKPDLIIAVDALAARSSRRLNRTIQIADTGIHPGSGVGNHRNGITEETVGVPVIAIGVPTVVDAATIVNDTMENLIAALESSETLKGVGVVLQGYNAAEKYELVKELISPHLNGLYVTPKDIDETVKRISYTISEALNLLFTQGHAHNEESFII